MDEAVVQDESFVTHIRAVEGDVQIALPDSVPKLAPIGRTGRGACIACASTIGVAVVLVGESADGLRAYNLNDLHKLFASGSEKSESGSKAAPDAPLIKLPAPATEIRVIRAHERDPALVVCLDYEHEDEEVGKRASAEQGILLLDVASLLEGKLVKRGSLNAGPNRRACVVAFDEFDLSCVSSAAEPAIAAVLQNGDAGIYSFTSKTPPRVLHDAQTTGDAAVSVACSLTGEYDHNNPRSRVLLSVGTLRGSIRTYDGLSGDLMGTVPSPQAGWIPVYLMHLAPDALQVAFMKSNAECQFMIFYLDDSAAFHSEQSFLGELLYSSEPFTEAKDEVLLADCNRIRREHCIFFAGVANWPLFAVASSRCTEIECVGLSSRIAENPEENDLKDFAWQNVKLGEGHTIASPTDDDYADTYPVGIAMDLCNLDPVPNAAGDGGLIRNVPRLLLLTSIGRLISFAIVDDRPEAEYTAVRAARAPLPPPTQDGVTAVIEIANTAGSSIHKSPAAGTLASWQEPGEGVPVPSHVADTVDTLDGSETNAFEGNRSRSEEELSRPFATPAAKVLPFGQQKSSDMKDFSSFAVTPGRSSKKFGMLDVTGDEAGSNVLASGNMMKTVFRRRQERDSDDDDDDDDDDADDDESEVRGAEDDASIEESNATRASDANVEQSANNRTSAKKSYQDSTDFSRGAESTKTVHSAKRNEALQDVLGNPGAKDERRASASSAAENLRQLNKEGRRLVSAEIEDTPVGPRDNHRTDAEEEELPPPMVDCIDMNDVSNTLAGVMSPNLQGSAQTAEKAMPQAQIRSILLEMQEELVCLERVREQSCGVISDRAQGMFEQLEGLFLRLNQTKNDMTSVLRDQEGSHATVSDSYNEMCSLLRDIEELSLRIKTDSVTNPDSMGLSEEVLRTDRLLDEKRQEVEKAVGEIERQVERLNVHTRSTSLRRSPRVSSRQLQREAIAEGAEVAQKINSSISLQGMRLRRLSCVLDSIEAQFREHRRRMGGRNGADIGLSQARLESLSITDDADEQDVAMRTSGAAPHDDSHPVTNSGARAEQSESSPEDRRGVGRLQPSVAEALREIAMQDGRDSIRLNPANQSTLLGRGSQPSKRTRPSEKNPRTRRVGKSKAPATSKHDEERFRSTSDLASAETSDRDSTENSQLWSSSDARPRDEPLRYSQRSPRPIIEDSSHGISHARYRASRAGSRADQDTAVAYTVTSSRERLSAPIADYGKRGTEASSTRGARTIYSTGVASTRAALAGIKNQDDDGADAWARPSALSAQERTVSSALKPAQESNREAGIDQSGGPRSVAASGFEGLSISIASGKPPAGPARDARASTPFAQNGLDASIDLTEGGRKVSHGVGHLFPMKTDINAVPQPSRHEKSDSRLDSKTPPRFPSQGQAALGSRTEAATGMAPWASNTSVGFEKAPGGPSPDAGLASRTALPPDDWDDEHANETPGAKSSNRAGALETSLAGFGTVVAALPDETPGNGSDSAKRKTQSQHPAVSAEHSRTVSGGQDRAPGFRDDPKEAKAVGQGLGPSGAPASEPNKVRAPEVPSGNSKDLRKAAGLEGHQAASTSKPSFAALPPDGSEQDDVPTASVSQIVAQQQNPKPSFPPGMPKPPPSGSGLATFGSGFGQRELAATPHGGSSQQFKGSQTVSRANLPPDGSEHDDVPNSNQLNGAAGEPTKSPFSSTFPASKTEASTSSAVHSMGQTGVTQPLSGASASAQVNASPFGASATQASQGVPGTQVSNGAGVFGGHNSNPFGVSSANTVAQTGSFGQSPFLNVQGRASAPSMTNSGTPASLNPSPFAPETGGAPSVPVFGQSSTLGGGAPGSGPGMGGALFPGGPGIGAAGIPNSAFGTPSRLGQGPAFGSQATLGNPQPPAPGLFGSQADTGGQRTQSGLFGVSQGGANGFAGIAEQASGASGAGPGSNPQPVMFGQGSSTQNAMAALAAGTNSLVQQTPSQNAQNDFTADSFRQRRG